MDDVGSLTGQVGTALYVAPELSTKAAKAIYNQKVDIYSLGIIFFEMCYKPLNTGMERVKVLLNLRSKEIILPDDMTDTEMPHQVHLLRYEMQKKALKFNSKIARIKECKIAISESRKTFDCPVF